MVMLRVAGVIIQRRDSVDTDDDEVVMGSLRSSWVVDNSFSFLVMLGCRCHRRPENIFVDGEIMGIGGKSREDPAIELGLGVKGARRPKKR
jgi:hypothetical protein